MAEKKSGSKGAEGEVSKVVRKETSRALRVMLTDEEICGIARNMTDEMSKMNALEKDLAGIKADFKAKIEMSAATIGRYKTMVENGYDYRETPCVETTDYEDGRFTCVRLDTGEVVEDRGLSPHERQMSLAE